MKNVLKAAALSVGLLSVMGLTACQSQAPAQQAKHNMPAKGDRQFNGEHRQNFHAHDRRDGGPHAAHHHGAHRGNMDEARGFGPRGEQRRGPMTEAQKAQFEKIRTERQQQFAALQQACATNVGKTISVKVGEKTIEGQCQVQFRPTRPDAKTPNTAPNALPSNTPSKTVTPATTTGSTVANTTAS